MIHGIGEETVLEKNEQAVKLKVFIPASSDYFDGHFPDFKLLPAVAQIDLVLHYAQKYFGTKLSTPDIRRFKFSDKIFPDTDVYFELKINRENGKMSFSVTDGKDVTFSSGTYTFA